MIIIFLGSRAGGSMNVQVSTPSSSSCGKRSRSPKGSRTDPKYFHIQQQLYYMSEFFAKQPSAEWINERMKGYQVWIEVDLDAIGKNIDTLRSMTDAELVPCIKKNAYAHGVTAIAAYLKTKGVNRALVAKLWEAEKIKKAGIEIDVINMDPLFAEHQFDTVVSQDITQTIYQKDPARKLSDAAVKAGKEAKVWIKVDTGLGRVGVRYPEAIDFITYLNGLPNIKITGLFSTLLEDDNDPAQIKRLKDIGRELAKRGIQYGGLSAASSHGIFFQPDSHMDAVRPGVMLFGFYPVPEAEEIGIELYQAISLKGKLEHVKWVDEGTPLTYGAAFIAPKRMKVGTMHMGYSDGYMRQLSKKGIVEVDGQIKPILGGVSINHLIIDLADTDAETGDTVTAIAQTGPNDAKELCRIAGLEPYQMAVWMSPLTPRVYYMGGKPVAVSEPVIVG